MYLLRKLIYIAGLAALLVSQPGYALGLGESELHSALNQPLKADIKLTNLRGLGENEIIVRLATNADFERAGLERQEFYSQLQFEVMLDHESGPVVRVTTQRPVREPYLNFLVEARWASGRLLREYTFLLDLPTYDDDRRAQPVEAARADARAAPMDRPRRGPRQQPGDTRSPEPDTRTGTAGSGSDTYGPVGDSDTLWEIALQVRPGRDVSVQQTMLAIQRKNPEAFINGNINLLRKGQVLRLPNRGEIQGLSQQQAVREVANHNRQWSDKAMGAQLDAGQRSGSAPTDTGEVSGQVRLATPNQSGSDSGAQGSGDSADNGSELESELAGAQEELDRTRRENRELSSRVEELEEQIETMESLVEASNEQLSALQAAARESQEEAQADSGPEADTPATDEEDTAEVAEQAEEPSAEAAAEDEVSSEQQVAEEEATAREERARRVVRSIPEPKTLVDHLLENILWIALGLLVILLGVYYVLRRRAQSADTEAADDEFATDFETEDFSGSQDDFDSSEEDMEGFDLSRAPEDDEEPADWMDEDESGVEAETGDVVGEADIYIAYGKLDQAEELLLKGLEKEPGSPEVLSKLLEVYAENRDVTAFDQYYARLLNTDDRPAIQRAGELRDTIPGAGEFDVGALEHGAAVGFGEEEQTRAEPSMDFSDLDDESSEDLEFNLDLDEDQGEVEPGTAESKASDDDDLSQDDDFHFDLDEDDTDVDEPAEPASGEKELEASDSRYDLSFNESGDQGEEKDDFTLDFELEDDTSTDASDTGVEEAEGEFPELDLNLDEDSAADLETETASAEEADDWSFDFETSEPTDLDKLDEELSGLDEEPSASEEPSADKEPSANITEDLPTKDEDLSFDPAEPAASEASTVKDSEGESDFNFDDMDMDDMDLSSLDQEMSDLDADLDEERPSEATPAPETADTSNEEEAMFEEALSGFSSDESQPTDEPEAEPTEEDMDAELDFLADTDEAATKLDLARAYIDMGDADGARDILEEVTQEGNDEQKREAEELLSRIES